MWSTFVPVIPNSVLPGTISCSVAVVAVTMVYDLHFNSLDVSSLILYAENLQWPAPGDLNHSLY